MNTKNVREHSGRSQDNSFKSVECEVVQQRCKLLRVLGVLICCEAPPHTSRGNPSDRNA